MRSTSIESNEGLNGKLHLVDGFHPFGQPRVVADGGGTFGQQVGGAAGDLQVPHGDVALVGGVQLDGRLGQFGRRHALRRVLERIRGS